MELVEGPTLADRIKGGALPLEEALAIARQIADALEAAHEKGIVHRDLKPANIKIKPDGTVKVLDFGLAKIAEQVAAAGSSEASTVAMGATVAGQIMGTAAYMAPEQARGKAVDKRADIWAFGVVLHEMLTGRRLFEGETFPTRWPVCWPRVEFIQQNAARRKEDSHVVIGRYDGERHARLASGFLVCRVVVIPRDIFVALNGDCPEKVQKTEFVNRKCVHHPSRVP
jgi:serine/threonine protein kinase